MAEVIICSDFGVQENKVCHYFHCFLIYLPWSDEIRLEKEMATHSSILAWKIPGTEEPGGLPSMGSHRVGHDWATLLSFSFLEGLVGLHRTIQLQLLQHYWSGLRLELLWYWMVCLEMNRDHSVVFEIASKYCILDSFVDHDGYSISSKGFLPTVVDNGHLS